MKLLVFLLFVIIGSADGRITMSGRTSCGAAAFIVPFSAKLRDTAYQEI